MPSRRTPKDPLRAARLRYRQRRHDLAVASEALRLAAAEMLTFSATTRPLRQEAELLLRELERLVTAADLKVEWPEPPPDRQESF
jgi:hypothetical protein